MANAKAEWNWYWNRKRKENLVYKVYDFIASFYRNRIIAPALFYFLNKNFKKGQSLLHAGCGGGEVDRFVANLFQITAVDFSPKAVSIYKKNNPESYQVVLADIFRLPFGDNYFDGAYNLGVLEHYEDRDVVLILKELSRVVKKGGRIVIFWPPEFGLSVLFFEFFYFVARLFKLRKIKFYPEEINRLRAKNQAQELFAKADMRLIDFYFGWRDLFTYCVLVGEVLSE